MMCRTAVLVALLAVPGLAAAQHDYRNLDHGRPISTEDAYPVERGALEVMFPWSHEREAGESGLMFEPEFMWGSFRNAMVGLGAPILLGDGGGLAGLRPFAFYNFNTETSSLPAVGLRLDVTVPVGALGGDGVLTSATALFTRSFGTTRLHLNTGATVGEAVDAPLEDAPSRWNASLAVDHTLWRWSMVVMADVQFAKPLMGSRKEWLGGAGIRMQVTPTVVFDIGAARRLAQDGPDLVVTAGLTRSFALTGGVE